MTFTKRRKKKVSEEIGRYIHNLVAIPYLANFIIPFNGIILGLFILFLAFLYLKSNYMKRIILK